MSSKPDESVLIQLAEEVYKEEAERNQVGAWKPFPFEGDDPTTGLQMEAYFNKKTKQVVVTVAGTQLTDKGDLAANMALATGNFGSQFRAAIEKSTALIHQVNNSDITAGFNITVTGHSLGGAQA